MNELPNPRSHDKDIPVEEVTTLAQDQLDILLVDPELDLLPKEGYLTEEASINLTKWTRENADNLKTILADRHYPEEELSDAAIARLRLACPPCPGYISTQRKKDAEKNKRTRHELRRELVEFNHELKEILLANHDIPVVHLKKLMADSLQWMDIPNAELNHWLEEIDRALNGARGELNFEQYLNTKAVQDAGIAYELSSVEGDLNGADFYITIPLETEEAVVLFRVGVNVKFGRGNIGYGADYRMESNGVASVWSGTTVPELNGRILLDEPTAEQRGFEVTRILTQIAKDACSHNQDPKNKRIGREIGRISIESSERDSDES